MRTRIRIAFLLVKFILIKIGNAPILIVQTIIDKLYTIVSSLSKRAKIIIGLSVFLVFFASYTVFLLAAAYQLPTPTRLISSPNPLTTQIYDRNGNLLYNLYEERNRTLVNLSDIPKDFIQATLTIEDRNFYHHIGIDPVAIVRALYHNSRNETLEGASTITQQLIKNSLLNPEKTYARKFKEIVLSLWTA